MFWPWIIKIITASRSGNSVSKIKNHDLSPCLVSDLFAWKHEDSTSPILLQPCILQYGKALWTVEENERKSNRYV